MKKKLVLPIIVISLTILNMVFTPKPNSSNRSEITLEMIKASADENSEDDVPDPDPYPIPFKNTPPDWNLLDYSPMHESIETGWYCIEMSLSICRNL